MALPRGADPHTISDTIGFLDRPTGRCGLGSMYAGFPPLLSDFYTVITTIRKSLNHGLIGIIANRRKNFFEI